MELIYNMHMIFIVRMKSTFWIYLSVYMYVTVLDMMYVTGATLANKSSV